MKTAVLATGVAGLMMLLGADGGVAAADTQDDQFLQTVRAQGINVDPGALIGFAHQMCDVIGGPAAIGPMMGFMGSQGLSAQQAATVAILGTRVYCPDRTPVVPPMFAPA